jgi:hypothetical protein
MKDAMKKLTILILSMLLYSCAKDEFRSPINSNPYQTSAKESFSSQSCADFTYVRPPVDLLFVWDNSTSSLFFDTKVKQALNNIINNISDRFDYNVMMAPLLGNGNTGSYFFSRSGLNPGSGITTIDKSQAANYLDQFPKVQGSYENGVSRVVDLLHNNQTNGVFRQGAYTLVVMMSNDDDNSWVDPNATYEFDPYRRDQYLNGKSHDLLCLRGNYDSANSGLYSSLFSRYGSNCAGAPAINSMMMRFISISALFSPNSCTASSQVTTNYIYRKTSEKIYSTGYTNSYSNPQTIVMHQEEGPDAFNICYGNYLNVFDGVNNAITDAIIAHEYRFWPLAPAGQEIDPASLNVTMSNGSTFQAIPNDVQIVRDLTGKNDRDNNGNPVHGYRIVNGVGTFNTRFLPTQGEPYTGQVIELFGNAKVTYPACLLINFTEPDAYYGYVHLADRPLESSIELRINGNVITQGGPNGWELLKDGTAPRWLSNFNIKIVSPSDFTPKTPGDLKTGYFLKLSGSAIYSNNAKVEVNYQPTLN